MIKIKRAEGIAPINGPKKGIMFVIPQVTAIRDAYGNWKIKRITNVIVNLASVTCSVESQSKLSTWDFTVDFNDYGHISSEYWIVSSNSDSLIPKYYSQDLSNEIKNYLIRNGIYTEQYSKLVENNEFLSTEDLIEINLKKFKYITQTVATNYSSNDYKKEHIFVAISLLLKEGFVRIKAVPIKEATKRNKKQFFGIDSITINGESSFKKGRIFPKNSKIVIKYYLKRMIKMPYSKSSLINKNCHNVAEKMRNLGFVEVKLHPIKDLIWGILKRDESIESVSIGYNDVEEGKEYEYDQEIDIYYHAFK